MIKFDSIYKPTPLYKKFLILNLLESKESITQREIARNVGISVSMVNLYLESYEKEGLIETIHDSTRLSDYTITQEGKKEKQLLNMMFLEASLDLYNLAKNECIRFINKIKSLGFKNLLFYGAGEVCELIIYAINNVTDASVNILAIIDDDKKKIGLKISNKDVISINDITKYEYDAILVSSYVHSDRIENKLITKLIDKEKIIKLVELLD